MCIQRNMFPVFRCCVCCSLVGFWRMAVSPWLLVFLLYSNATKCNHLKRALVAMVAGWQEAETSAMRPARSSSAYVHQKRGLPWLTVCHSQRWRNMWSLGCSFHIRSPLSLDLVASDVYSATTLWPRVGSSVRTPGLFTEIQTG